MPVDKQGIARNFGRHINSYERYARVQKRMAHQLLDRICQPDANHAGRIIEIGCGTGYFTQLLAEAYPQSEIIAIDICGQALEAARLKLCNCLQLRFCVADGEFLQGHKCDLLVSNATFQWFNDLPAALARYHACLRPGGRLYFATLGRGTFVELYTSINKTLGERSHCLGADYDRHFPSPKAIERSLSRAGFSKIRVEAQSETELYDSVRDFLYAVKRTGSGNPKPMVLTPRSLVKLIRFYAEHFSDQGKIKATYKIIYGEAVKPPVS